MNSKVLVSEKHKKCCGGSRVTTANYHKVTFALQKIMITTKCKLNCTR